MNMDLLTKEHGTTAVAVHLEVVKAYDVNEWKELTEQQQIDVVGVVIAYKKMKCAEREYRVAWSKLSEMPSWQQSSVSIMLESMDEQETD